MIDFEVLSSYSFFIAAIGTVVLSMTAGAIGCITVLKGQSLIGDAIGHATFPGIVLSFMLFLQKDPILLIIGAIFSGAIAFILIQMVRNNSKLDLDAILAIVMSSFFGLGMVLKSYIQGNENYSAASQSGLQNYIFGQAAYIMKEDVKLILLVSIPTIILISVFYKEIKIFLFDETYSKTIGLNTKVLYGIILLITIGIIAVGLKIVGTILISSLLIIPSITALQWSEKFSSVLLIAAVIGGISAFIGTYISTVYSGMSTGPVIILIMSIFSFISLIFGPRGMILNIKRRSRVDEWN
ncbi:metal ABC transporter permease [Anaerosphaera multitolerans]|uniref:Metal ABC transporter permease n=1 Tax=Anaerosphaera multitolerans TaxID=2487351 RepID=A0A437S5I8_9FIRM|nr:metal ABC transporter permease [Anaerosphaera multitolerans]